MMKKWLSQSFHNGISSLMHTQTNKQSVHSPYSTGTNQTTDTCKPRYNILKSSTVTAMGVCGTVQFMAYTYIIELEYDKAFRLCFAMQCIDVQHF